MPKNKKGATRGRARTRGRGGGRGGGNQGRNSYEDDDDLDYVPFARQRRGLGAHNDPKGFSLQSEAHNTQRPHNWSSDQKLRNVKVEFVSAGDLKPAKLVEIETAAAMADMTLETKSPSVQSSKQSPQQFTPAETEDEVPDSFMIDTEGAPEPVVTRFQTPIIRSGSPTPSDSSEEVILYRGRDSAGRGLRRNTPPKQHDPYAARIKLIDDEIHLQRKLLSETIESTSNVHSSTKHSETISIEQAESIPLHSDAVIEVEEIVAIEVEVERNSVHNPRQVDVGRSGRRTRSRKHRSNEEEEEALIDDYIANIEEEELDLLVSYNQRDLGGEDMDAWEETDASQAAETKGEHKGDWDRSDLVDFDDLSTSDEVLGAVQAILSKRERPSGLQYLVVWEGQSVDEARWIPQLSLVDTATLVEIEQFEAEEKLVAEFFGDDGEEDESDDSDGVDGDGDSDEEDDESDLVQRKIDRMTDEKIAKLLAKQEELGLGSDELILFDDSADDQDDALGMDFFLPPKRSKRSIRGPNRGTGYFPPAKALSDAYDGFDVMDFDRPSLKKKPKGRRGKLAFDLSDSELEESMQIAWETDRTRKKERKEEREELRAAGLLGKKKTGKTDMKAKYKEGMGIDSIKAEIKDFLIGGHSTLALPPMDKGDRKIVHELANAFNLKSKSAGSGKTRFPVLYRTTRTMAFHEGAFAAVESRITRRFLPRMDLKGKRSVRGAGRGGGFASSAVSYRDGDVVGASAPELGIENRGRAMLEKMGWSTGTALGALNNKGILQPVSHVVKTTKAGLG